MGVRGELFSTRVMLQNRTYFFNVKENRLGDLYLNIVESKNRDEGGFERQSVILFAEDLQEFLQGFDESLRVLEKAFREKRKGAPRREDRHGPSDREDAPRRPSSREDRHGPSDREAAPRRAPRRDADPDGRRPRRSREDGNAPPRSFKPKPGAGTRSPRSDRGTSYDKDKSPYPPKRRVVVKKGKKQDED